MNLIEINNLHKTYQTKEKEIEAIKNITLNIIEGEIIGIIGPSGCGKSTLLNILTGLDTNYKGNIKYNKEINIGYMMQTDCNLPWLNVYNNAILGLKLKKILTKGNINYTNLLLKKYELDTFKEVMPSNLSGGQNQRLSLIRTLATKPNLLLLDEPFSKLDLDTRLSISDDVVSSIKSNKITSILITHDLGEAITLCDRLVVLSKRPSTIKKIINIDLKENIPSKKRNNKNYIELYNYIWSILNDE